MSTASPPREPTMEEILASIRRIIAEEGQGTSARGSDAPPDAAPLPPVRESRAPGKILPAGPLPSSRPPLVDDILLLTDLIDEDLPLTRLADLPPPAAVGDPFPLPMPEPPPAPFAVPPPAPTPAIVPPPGHPAAPAPSAPQPRPVDILVPPAPTVTFAMPPAPPPAAKPVPQTALSTRTSSVEVESPLMTVISEELVANSMREVAEAVRAEKVVPATPTPGGTPLEGLVLEALRPALKAWIDQNLPEMVERLMKDELRRLARRIENE